MGLFDLFKKNKFKGGCFYQFYNGEGGEEQGFFCIMEALNKSAEETGIKIQGEPLVYEGMYFFNLAQGGRIMIVPAGMFPNSHNIDIDMVDSSYTQEDWERLMNRFGERMNNWDVFVGANVYSKRRS